MYSQETINRNMIYRTTILLISDPSFHCYGALYEVNDSSISISSHGIKDYDGPQEVTEVYIDDIKLINTRKSFNIRKGLLFGAASGFVIGGLTGLIEGGHSNWFGSQTAWENAFETGAGFMILGAITGALVGSTKIKIPINGSMDNYNRNKDRLKGYSLKK